MRKVLLIIIACVALFSLLFIQQQSAAAQDWQQKVDPSLLSRAPNADVEFIIYLSEQADVSATQTMTTKLEKAEYVYQTLSSHAALTQAPIIATLDTYTATYTSYWAANVIYAIGSTDALTAVAAMSAVEYVDQNSVFRAGGVSKLEVPSRAPSALTYGLSNTRTDLVWSSLNITGTGVVVGGQDTGYEWDHMALKDNYRGWDGTTADHNYNWHDSIHKIHALNSGLGSCGVDSAEPCDDHFHGTHTMGTMVGNDANGTAIGMAPGAEWISCRNMDRGWGTVLTYLECFQWFIAPTDLNGENPDPSKAPHVINNSWGCPPIEGCNSGNFSVLQTATENVRASGIVPVVSAGNSGSGCNSVNTPAAIFDASFSVGAIDSNNNIVGFSSRGPVTVDGSNRPKPDIAAPGHNVLSAGLNNTYTYASGTSMAGPHVAGLVALIISAKPELAGNVDEIENIIRITAQTVPTATCTDTRAVSPNNVYGHGTIDAFTAVYYAQNGAVPTSVAIQSSQASNNTAMIGQLITALALLTCFVVGRIHIKRSLSSQQL